MDPLDAVPDAFKKLEMLGIVKVTDDEVYCRIEKPIDDYVYRTLFYSEKQHARAREIWGPQYDRDTDYGSKLSALLEKSG